MINLGRLLVSPLRHNLSSRRRRRRAAAAGRRLGKRWALPAALVSLVSVLVSIVACQLLASQTQSV